MYTKEELEAMGTLQLMELASKFGISINDGDGKETVIYAILDKAAETEATSTTATQKRKRTRIVKKDTDKYDDPLRKEKYNALNMAIDGLQYLPRVKGE